MPARSLIPSLLFDKGDGIGDGSCRGLSRHFILRITSGCPECPSAGNRRSSSSDRYRRANLLPSGSATWNSAKCLLRGAATSVHIGGDANRREEQAHVKAPPQYLIEK